MVLEKFLELSGDTCKLRIEHLASYPQTLLLSSCDTLDIVKFLKHVLGLCNMVLNDNRQVLYVVARV